ncbi:MAG: GspE/PulE family protein [Patescibacteria group bacterium]|nr:GspE/PulE family protein [Patescibacteria group bacterium]MDD5490866.1 GspE/PulE family protein [Patescibacteria group bacterium]
MSFLNPRSDDLKKIKKHARSWSAEEAREQFTEKMQEIRIKEKEKTTAEEAATRGLPYINLKGIPISPEVLSSISKKQAEELKIICFFNNAGQIRLGALEPEKPEMKELLFQLEERFHGQTKIYLISEESFNQAFKLYDAIPEIKEVPTGVTISEEELSKFRAELKTFKDLNARIQKASITDVMAMIIASSLESRASDIHIEAEEEDVKIRFRIDGVLQDTAVLEKSVWPRIISRLKVVAGLKINVEDAPQDGRFTIFIKEGKTDVRVSTLPTAYGESVVMRLLKSTATSLQFEELGLRGGALEKLKKEIERPNGMIITTGPTGSGKTTTLYAIINKLNEPGIKIITLEDPIEYKLKGINQSQIDYSKDYTFAKGLRSILRQDPDIVMVGEIRDLETAEIAIQAALTGHLVISTIHTNSAAGALPRFLSMGAKPFLLAPAINAIVGQRLVRKICEECKKEISPDTEILKRVKGILAELPEAEKKNVNLDKLKFYAGQGCAACNGIGFKGRVGIYEIMNMNPEIEKLILSGNLSEYQIQDIAVKDGMVTMVQDGLLKALDGITSVEEVFKVAE